jgi:hypothetical protein
MRTPTERTPAQAEASRRNGAKSRGPASPEGKAISSQNARKHGLRARQLHLAPDEQEDFDDLSETYYQHYLPSTPFESYLVDQCVTADWLLMRARAMQSSLIELELAESASDIEQAYPNIDRTGMLTIGFRLLNERTSAFSVLDAHQGRLLRQFTRFTAQLESAREQAPQPGLTAEEQGEEEDAGEKKSANEPEPLLPAEDLPQAEAQAPNEPDTLQSVERVQPVRPNQILPRGLSWPENSLRTASSTPLMNLTDSSPENRRANSSASSMTTAAGVPSPSIS